jgi:Tfp pilus assembly protein PilE
MTSVVGQARREQVAAPLASSAKTQEHSHLERKKSFWAEHDDFKSPWKWNNSRNRVHDATEEEPPKQNQSPEVQTTVMCACWGK